jgi:hypothetical protein
LAGTEREENASAKSRRVVHMSERLVEVASREADVLRHRHAEQRRAGTSCSSHAADEKRVVVQLPRRRGET